MHFLLQSYHYHLEPKAWSEDDDALIGIISDGFFGMAEDAIQEGLIQQS